MRFTPRKRSPMVRANVRVAAAPGTLESREDSPPPQLRVISYGPDFLQEDQPAEVSELKTPEAAVAVQWVDVQGLGDAEVLRELGERYELNDLSLEDVLNLPQRPKLEQFEDHQFVVVRMITQHVPPKSEQLSIFFGSGLLLSFQEQPGDVFDPVRERIQKGRPRIRKGSSDYLAYALLDAVVDSYFPALRHLGEQLDSIEESLYLHGPNNAHGHRLTELKRDLISFSRYVKPLPELLEKLLKEDNDQVQESTRPFLRDCLDHARQASELIDSYREIANGLMDLYLSLMSQRMNEVMKVLTIIATVFIPLSFIAGVYGMNFDPDASPWNMPELSWYFGYPLALGVMLLVAGGMLTYFWRRGWFR